MSTYLGNSSKSAGFQHNIAFATLVNGVVGNYGGGGVPYGTGTVVGIAMDIDAGKVWVSINGSWVNAAPPGDHIYGIDADTWYPAMSCNQSNGEWTANFGATVFAYTVPSGFNAGIYA